MKKNQKYQDCSLLILRLTIAAVFFYAAYGKVDFLSQGLVVGSMVYLMWALVVIEPLLGLGVLLGYKTKWASLGLAVIMFGSIFVLNFAYDTQFFSNPLGLGWDYNLLLLAGNLVLFSFGAGKYSMEERK